MSSIDDAGFTRKRFQDEWQEVADKWLEYFPNTRTNSSSVNGRIISVQAELVDEANAKIQSLS